MSDGFVRLRDGETRPIVGRASAQSGTLTIQGQPKCTLYTLAGEPVDGINDRAVDNFDPDPGSSVRVWLDLDTHNTPTEPLAPGWYFLVFTFSAGGSDGQPRTYEPKVDVLVTSATG